MNNATALAAAALAGLVIGYSIPLPSPTPEPFDLHSFAAAYDVPRRDATCNEQFEIHQRVWDSGDLTSAEQLWQIIAARCGDF